MSQQAHARNGAFAYADWIPFVCVLVAILLVGGSAVSWVTSPNWGVHNTISAPRDVGTVPQAPGKLVAYVSPYRIDIPAIKTDAPIIDVGTTADDQLAIPRDPRVTGWWKYGAKPGADKGTAIIAGHINYSGVPGALGQIGRLNPGDKVIIHGMRAGKKTALTFSITGVHTYTKVALPYKEIFNQQSVGRLALVTCGGPFDPKTGNYLDNIVAYAVPA